jgi:hypothetical protein
LRATAGRNLDLDIRRSGSGRQVILRDITVEVVGFHSVAPTFTVGASIAKKPVIAVELKNRGAPLPWSFHARWIADSPHGPYREFAAERVTITTSEWDTLLLRLLAKDRGIYKMNIDIVLQQDDQPAKSVRVTPRPMTIGFFERPEEDHPDFKLLRDRHQRLGGITRQRPWLSRDEKNN